MLLQSISNVMFSNGNRDEIRLNPKLSCSRIEAVLSLKKSNCDGITIITYISLFG